MTKKLIAIDLDGTLLRSDQTISEYSLETLKKVKSLGHTIIIATGRPYLMAKDYYQQLELDSPMITFNGALTHLPNQVWEGQLAKTIDRRLVLNLLEQADEFELDFVAAEYKDHFFLTMEQADRIDPSIFGRQELTPDLALSPESITADPLALLAQTRRSDKYQLAKEIKAYFKGQLEVDSWGGPLNILEFSPKGVHKAFALAHLIQELGIQQDDIIAFGDEHNDTEMLAFAGQGYAMKNANPILLEHADQQLPWTNDQDGVARQLEKLFLLKCL